jgi:hypothetical protein
MTKFAKTEDPHLDPIPDAGRTGRVSWSNREAKDGSRGSRRVSTPVSGNAHIDKERSAKETGSSDEAIAVTSAPPAVYLNFPFQRNYERFAVALVSGTVCFGLTPRIVPQDSASNWRVDKIFRLARACAYSLHELSPVAGGRLNMAWELGFCMGLTRDTGHQYSVLVKDKHRLQISLSNLAGIDVHVWAGNEEKIFNMLRGIYRRSRGGALSPALLVAVFHATHESYLRLRKQGYDPIYEDMDCFDKVILAARLHLADEFKRMGLA